MVFLFRDKSIVNILFLALLAIAVHMHGFTMPMALSTNQPDGFFSVLLHQYFGKLFHSVGFVLYLLIIIAQAIRLNFFLAEQKMFPNSDYTVGMSYILLTAVLPDWMAITPALLANFLLIWIYIKLTRLYNHTAPKTLLFNIGLLVTLTVLCYHPTAILVLVVLFALGIMRPFKLQEWFTLLIGILLPVYFLSAWLFLTNQMHLMAQFFPTLVLDLPMQYMSQAQWIGLGGLVFALLVGLINWQRFNSRLVIQMRKNWSALFLMCLILVAAPFVFKQAGLVSAALCLVPFSAFVAAAFSFPKRLLFPNFLFWVLVGIIVYNNWFLLKF